MRNKKGQFVKGQRASPATEFKKGQHWRERKPYWNREWLYDQYIVQQRSASQIASEQGCNENNIFYFLKKFDIQTRSMSEVRSIKYWGSSGEDNPMHGRFGEDNPRWKGGCTPDRQALYSSREWIKASSFVWKRDGGTCQRCGIKKRKGYSFHIHHIVPFSESEDLRSETSNLILLCADCHFWIHSKENTEKEFIKGGDKGDC